MTPRKYEALDGIPVRKVREDADTKPYQLLDLAANTEPYEPARGLVYASLAGLVLWLVVGIMVASC